MCRSGHCLCIQDNTGNCLRGMKTQCSEGDSQSCDELVTRSVCQKDSDDTFRCGCPANMQYYFGVCVPDIQSTYSHLLFHSFMILSYDVAIPLSASFQL